jgi:hypothetical protein
VAARGKLLRRSPPMPKRHLNDQLAACAGGGRIGSTYTSLGFMAFVQRQIPLAIAEAVATEARKVLELDMVDRGKLYDKAGKPRDFTLHHPSKPSFLGTLLAWCNA